MMRGLTSSIVLCASLMLVSSAWAVRPWQGITAGQSTKAQVLKRFGKPHRVVTKHGNCAEVLNYQADSAIRGTQQTNFCLDAKGLVVEISVFPDRSITRKLVEEAYGTKYQKKLTDEFREYYYYKSQGMAVFFDKEGKLVHSIMFSPDK